MQGHGTDDERDDDAGIESEAEDVLETDEPEGDEIEPEDDTDPEAEAEADTDVQPEATDGPTRDELLERIAALEARSSRAPEPDGRHVTQAPPTDDEATKEQALRDEHRMAAMELRANKATLEHLEKQGDPLAPIVKSLVRAQELGLTITARAIGKMEAERNNERRERLDERDEQYIETRVEAPVRKAFRDFIAKHKGYYHGISECHLAFDGHMLREERARLATKRNGTNGKAAAPEKKLGPAPRPVTATEKRERGVEPVMTEDQLDKKVERLRAAGRHDDARRLLATANVKD